MPVIVECNIRNFTVHRAPATVHREFDGLLQQVQPAVQLDIYVLTVTLCNFIFDIERRTSDHTRSHPVVNMLHYESFADPKFRLGSKCIKKIKINHYTVEEFSVVQTGNNM